MVVDRIGMPAIGDRSGGGAPTRAVHDITGIAVDHQLMALLGVCSIRPAGGEVVGAVCPARGVVEAVEPGHVEHVLQRERQCVVTAPGQVDALDRVDAEEVRRPRVLDIAFIRNFMLIIGPISSLFDFLTFYILLAVLHADETLFQTGWFIESLTTQVLVIFVIRSSKSVWSGGAHPLLIMAAVAVVATGALLPLTPLGAYFGFVAPPPAFYAILAGLVVAYLLLVESVKRLFYRQLARRHGGID